MNRIVASILTLQQHLNLLASSPVIYRPTFCPHCSFGKLWCHGCYERKADRLAPASKSLNPIPIPRFICFGCRRTCSRLPECIAPRRWYDWAFQQVVLGLLLSGCSLCQCSRQCGLERRTIRRWWTWLNERGQAFEWMLRARLPELGRTVNFEAFWQNCLQTMSLSQVMAILDREGLRVP